MIFGEIQHSNEVTNIGTGITTIIHYYFPEYVPLH